MNPQLVITLVVLGFILVGLFQESIGAEIVMLSGLLLLVAFQIVTVEEALNGFANPSVLIIASLFVVGGGLRSTGALEIISKGLLGKPTAQTGMMRLLAPIAGLSAFMNNTPLVAFFIPVFVQLAKRLRVSPSRYLIPLSYSAILGGTCTLVGTSTNLVVDGILRKIPVADGGGAMGMFELTPVGLIVTVVGLIYLTTIGRRLLPDRQDLIEYIESHPREYTAEMLVRSTCPLVGNSVRIAGLRDLPGLYLFRIERGLDVVTPVDPQEIIKEGDILCFSGVASTVVDLQRIRGLDPVEHATSGDALRSLEAGSLDSLEGLGPAPVPAPRKGPQLCEAVVSNASPLVGQTIRALDFRTRYNASIIAVHRSGEKLQQKIGQIVVHAGDTLLIDAADDFVRRWRHSPDFILVSGVEDSAPVAHDRTWIALGIFLAVVLGMSLVSDASVVVALAGAVAMMLCRCVSRPDGARSIELSVLVLVAASLGLSKGLERSGAAEWLAHGMLSACQGYGTVAVIAAIYLLTMLLSELLSNNATAALMGSLAVATAHQTGMEVRPLLITVAIASSCAFATPIGYQTNLMVLNAGGYRFRDYVIVGLPLNILCFVVSIIVIPMVWKL